MEPNLAEMLLKDGRHINRSVKGIGFSRRVSLLNYMPFKKEINVLLVKET
jgi:hypothetical protein